MSNLSVWVRGGIASFEWVESEQRRPIDQRQSNRLFIYTGDSNGEAMFLYWGQYAVSGTSRDRRTLGLFSLLQEEMAKDEKGEDQPIVGLICLTQPNFQFEKNRIYSDKIEVNMKLDKSQLSFTATAHFRF